MSSILSGAIDCDVHVEPPSMDALLGYIEPYWHEFIRGGHLGVGHRLYPDHGRDALDNLLGVLTTDDREAVLTKNAAAFFDIGVPAVS